MAAQEPKTALKVVLGGMTIGAAGAEQARIHSFREAGEFLDTFRNHGHTDIDTARVYGGGSCEEYLGQLDLEKRGFTVDTKLSPHAKIGLPEGTRTTHRAEHLRKGLEMSLAALKTDKVNIFYLHSPDRTTSYEDTFCELNNLYKQGKFNRLGISNYMAWEVAQICEICIRNGWIQPTAYQGVYNAFHRAVEPELFPCLRKYGISFYEFNPLAGGYLTDRYRRDQNQHEEGSRFDPNRVQGRRYREKYWQAEYFDALDILRTAIRKHGLSEAECALRWVMNHSLLSKTHGDAIIIGASSSEQLEENLKNLEKGPLPDELVKALDEGWSRVKGVCRPYYIA